MKFDFKKECKGIISIICGSEINKDTEEKATEIGRLLAKNNYAISCGGLYGAMEAVCKGEKYFNGTTISFTNLRIYTIWTFNGRIHYTIKLRDNLPKVFVILINQDIKIILIFI